MSATAASLEHVAHVNREWNRLNAGSTTADAGKSGPAVATPPAPIPRSIYLPTGKSASTYTREQLTILYHCTHGELGRLLARRMAPLPIRVDGQILWFVDEVQGSQATVQKTLERWRKR